MSIADNIAALTTARNNIRDALEEKGVDASTHGFSSFAADIQSISGNGSVAWKAVNFIDYDGTVLYSYSLSEMQSMTEMPPLPSHNGLTCTGWNWTLAEIKAENKNVIVGALYETSDGATRLYMNIDQSSARTVILRLTCSGSEKVVIDWGDGSSALEYDSSSTEASHTYEQNGKYTISLLGGSVALGYGLYGLFDNIASSSKTDIAAGFLDKIELGNNVSTFNNIGALYGCDRLQSITTHGNITTVGTQTFRGCVSLKSIVIPPSTKTIAVRAFMDCAQLHSISLPKTINSINAYAFSNSAIKYISIPKGVAQTGNEIFSNCVFLSELYIPELMYVVGAGAFAGCSSLRTINIPNDVTEMPENMLNGCVRLCVLTIPSYVYSIGAGTLGYLYSMKELHINATTPPVLESSTSLQGLPQTCIIYVPPGSLFEYQNATNWSDYASQMQEEIM